MQPKDLPKMRGDVRLTLRDLDTGVEEIEEIHNLVMLLPRNVLLRTLIGNTTDIGKVHIKGIAVGTGTTTPVETNSQLATEVARKALNSWSAPSLDTDDAVATFRAYFSSTEANVVIREVALFGGSTWNAATANSGVLLSRAAVNKDKSAGNKTLTVEWTIRLEG